MSRIYISGKITGIESEALLLFAKAEKELQSKGYETVNPMALNHNHDKTWRSYMKEDIKALCDCDSIYLLSNWKDSVGSIIEMDIATHLGLDIMYESSAQTKTPQFEKKKPHYCIPVINDSIIQNPHTTRDLSVSEILCTLGSKRCANCGNDKTNLGLYCLSCKIF